MSWIKNFLQSFKNNEEEYEDSSLHNEQEEKSISKVSNNQPSQKMEARIAYHYPKGQFRFPVIPDEKNQRKETNPIKRQPREKEAPVKDAPKPVKVKESTVQKPVERTAERKTVNSATKNEKPIKKVRPFTPTEIPSPVYGFQRPKKINLVEHELTGFDTPRKIGTAKEPEIPALEDLILIEEKAEPVFTEKIDSINETVFPETIDNRPIAAELLKPADVKEPEPTIEPTPEPILNTEPIMELTAETTAELEQEQITELVPEPQEQEQITKLEQELKPEPESEPEPEPVLELEANQELELEQIQEQIPESVPETKEKPRRHLPFNVMMLKQDKRKLEEKSARLQIVENITPVVQPSSTVPEIAALPPETIQEEIVETEPVYYALPSLDLLNPPVFENADSQWLEVQEIQLQETLQNFNVGAKVVNVTQGPSVTRFEVQPEPGVKVNKITNLSDDIKLSLAARDIRIEAPIPGKHTIGIEVPNQVSRPVMISEIIHSSSFSKSTSPLTAVLGLDISGAPIVTDLKKMPHGLIAGATGSGKSVCINSILISLLYKASPEELKLLLIDPKMVELAPYNQIPHLVSPVITDVKAATAALKWAVDEMERRYELFAHTGVRDINRFNELAESHKRYSDKLPFIVIIIDELADLMMMSPADVEEAICRIAQKARACGIHLIVATQRPSVDVITGLIKANIPTRVAFSVSSQIDSRTIIDISGAEKLLGRGDMLFLENGSSKPVRLQGTYVTDEEIDKVVAHVRREREPEYLFEQEELLKRAQVTEEEDELFYEACEFVVDQNGASTSSLQRRFKIGYNRAARLMDMMEQNGFISGAKGSRPREVLISETDLEAIHETSTIN